MLCVVLCVVCCVLCVVCCVLCVVCCVLCVVCCVLCVVCCVLCVVCCVLCVLRGALCVVCCVFCVVRCVLCVVCFAWCVVCCVLCVVCRVSCTYSPNTFSATTTRGQTRAPFVTNYARRGGLRMEAKESPPPPPCVTFRLVVAPLRPPPPVLLTFRTLYSQSMCSISAQWQPIGWGTATSNTHRADDCGPCVRIDVALLHNPHASAHLL